jgi:LDH2 family malate/lactate/ureidoglycolate dehydrogenase
MDMSETTASTGKTLDADRADAVRMSEAEATAIGMRALNAIGYNEEDARIVVDQLIDNALCGYRFASLPRNLAIATDPKHLKGRQPIKIDHETPLSARMDGANNIGYVTCYRAAMLAAEKAKKTGFASVGVYNSYYSGRNAYFVEQIVKQGLVAFHIASAQPRVLPIGGKRPALGTNPICIGFPSDNGPVVFDMGTAALMWGDVMLHAHLGEELPAGIGFDKEGNASTNAAAVLEGGVVPFGGHKGYVLSLAVQSLGLLAGSALAKGQVSDYGFLFWVMDPQLMLPGGEFKAQMAELVQFIKSTPKRPGVDEIRIPSERAYRERERRRAEGLVYDRKVIDSLNAL